MPLEALADAAVADERRIAVLLPPFVEPSFLVGSWEECGFLPDCVGRPAHVASVSTFVDLGHVEDHLASASPLAQRGWGRSGLDGRTVADIAVDQVESATHLVLVGEAGVSDWISRCLTVLNPTATRTLLRRGAVLRLDAPTPPSIRVVPPWLETLQGDRDPGPGAGVFGYRRARPFDARRFADWLADPPRGLVRGKGQVWFATEPDRCFGYSCAGSVHRLFPAGRWWASLAEGAWPDCDFQRRRLLARWHPRFGDRRQELVFASVELDRGRVCASLDACLLPDGSLGDVLDRSRAGDSGSPPGPRTAPH